MSSTEGDPGPSEPLGDDDLDALADELRRLRELERVAPGATLALRTDPAPDPVLGHQSPARRPVRRGAPVVPVWAVMLAVILVFGAVAVLGMAITGDLH